MTRGRSLAAAVVVILLAIAGNTYLSFHVNGKLRHNQFVNCQQIEIVKDAERETIAEAAHLTATTKGQTAAQRAQGIIFFRDALDRLKPRRC